MTLASSLRQKKRYVVFEIISDNSFSFPEIKEEIHLSLARFWGELGLSRACPILMEEKFNKEKQRFIIKVNHRYVDELKAGVILSKKIKNTPIILRSLTTSGTLKKASLFLTK